MNIAAWIAVGLFAIWVFQPLWKAAPACPQPIAAAPVEAPDARLAHRLCDKEVDALLHASDIVEIERAAAIIQRVNCDIEGRL